MENLVSSKVSEFSNASTSSLLYSMSKWPIDINADLCRRLTSKLVSVSFTKASDLAKAVPVLHKLKVEDDEVWNKLLYKFQKQLPYFNDKNFRYDAGDGDWVLTLVVPEILMWRWGWDCYAGGDG